jgi:hypothetical protein
MGAVLPVHTPSRNLLFRDQNPSLAVREGHELFFFSVVAVFAAHLDSVGDHLFQRVALFV